MSYAPSGICFVVALVLALPAFAEASYEIDVSNDPAARDGEPSLGVNPSDPSNLVMGYMKSDRGQCAISTSFDRGRTWRSQVLRSLTDSLYSYCADPTLIFGADGTVYFAAIAFNQSLQIGHTVVTRSSDGGKTWTQPVEAIGGDTAPIDGFDRPWLAFDKATRTLYLTTMTIFSRPMGPLAHRYLIASRDGGEHWGKANVVDSPDYPADHWATGTITVAPDRSVAIAYTARQVPEAGMRCPCAVLATTRDGASYRRHTVPFTDTLLGISLPEQGEASALRLVYGPVVAADPTRSGRYAVAGAVWNGLGASALGQIGVAPRPSVRAQLFQSDNSGVSWVGPAVIGEDPAKDREHVWLAYSPSGALGVVWRTHAGFCCFGYREVWSVVSRDGGRTFDRPQRLSHSASPGTGLLFGLGDDFQSVVLDDSFLHAAWGDGRSGDDDVYYSRLPLGDRDPPQTSITRGPPRRSRRRTPTFRFRADEPDSTFECRLDRGRWRRCSAPQRYRKVSLGRHVFRVRAKDPAGNRDRTPARRRFTVVGHD